MRKIALTAMLLASPVSALENMWGMGEKSFDSIHNRIEACTVAENLAMKDALIKYSQRSFTVDNQTVCYDTQDQAYCDYISEVDSTTAGSVKHVIDRERHIENNTCFVKLQVAITPHEQLPVEVDIQKIYAPGQSISVAVDTKRPLYLYIFNVHPKGVDTLFPNQYTTNSLIDDKFEYPGEGVAVKASLPTGNESKETLLFLFTEQRQSFDVANMDRASLQELLGSIPSTEKRLIQKHILIKRRSQ